MARYNYNKYKSQSSNEPQSAGSSAGRYDYSKYRQDSGSLTPDQQRISNQEQSDFAQMDRAAQTGAQIQADEYRQRADEQALSDEAQMAQAQQTYADMPKVDEYRTAAHGLPVIGPVLRGLDAFSENQTVDKVAGVARSLYTPGASLGNIGAMTGVVERGLGRIAPNLGSTFGGRVAQKAIKEGTVGVPLGAGQSLASGNPDLMDAGKSGLIGGALGGIGGAAFPLIGRGIQAAENAAARGLGQAEARPSLGAAVNEFTRNVDNSSVPSYNTSEPLELPTLTQNPAGRGVLRAPSRVDIPEQSSRGSVADAVSAPPTQRQRAPQELYDQYDALRDEYSSINQQLGDYQQELLTKYKVTDSLLDAPLTPAEERKHSELWGILRNVSNKEKEAYQAIINAEKELQAPVRAVEAAPQATGEMRQPVIQSSESAVAPINPRITAGDPPAGTVKPPLQERGFVTTLKESPKTPESFVDKLKSIYQPITNEQTLAGANKRISKDVEESTSYVLGNSRFTADKAATAQRLIDHYNNTGNIQRAVDIAEKVSEEATRAGQAIQSLSMFNRLTPEGVLVYAQRIARKTNESLSIVGKEVKVTEDVAAQLTGLAQVSQKMTGVKDLSNDVLTILEKAKTGEKLTDTEAASLRRFVDESKQFIKETSQKPKPPRPPQEPKDKRVRDNVVSFLDAQEQAAKERLRARGIQISSTPLDVWADYAVIGASKMAKGAIKFADWSEQMVKDLGDDISPHLANLYDRAKQAYEQSTKVVTRQTVSDAERLTERVIKYKELGQSEADSLRTLAQKVSKLSGEEKRLASQDLQAVLQTLERPGLLKKVSSTQTIGQLLNPKTQVRNALGNELFYRVERLNKLLSAPIDIVRSKITGGERTVTFRTNNQGEYWSNWMRGLKAGWKGVNVNGLETQYDLGSPAFRGKYNPLTYMEKSLGAALKSFDTAAYMRAYNNTIGELATLRAINEGQRGSKELIQKYIREADDNMMKIADEYGRYVTLQDNNVISNGLVALKRGLNFKKDWGLGDLVLKYPKTPGNILMRALEYSPAGFVRSGMILARPWFKKEPNTAEVTQALSRAIIGTFGFTGLGYFLMDKGVLTGSASKDKDVRDLQRSAGQGQYQVNLSAITRFVTGGFDTAAVKLQEGDLLYTYDWMQPVSIAASIGANVKRNLSEGKGTLSGLAGTAYNSLEGGLSTLTEQSVLSGLKRAAEGYPGQTVTGKITDILSDIPASFVPTASNQINQLMDNNRRETYSPSKVDQSLNKAQAKIPGLAQDLPRQFDTLGRPKEAYQDNNAFNVLLNPGFASRYELSPEAKMVVDLINETGDETLAPRVPGKSITIEDPNDKKKNIQLKLNGDQFSRYQQLQGEKTREDIIKRYRPEASQKSRVDKVRGILTESGDEARKDLKKEIGVR